MELPEDCVLTYDVGDEAWYADTLPGHHRKSISVHASALPMPNGVAWEFEIKEQELGGRPVLSIRLFDDSFAAIRQVPELFDAFASMHTGEDRNAFRTLADARAVLDRIGAVDITKRVRGEA